MPLVHHVKGPANGRRVFLAIPTTDGLTAPTFVSVFEAHRALLDAGFSPDLCVEQGNCHVDDARNSLVRTFLMTDCEDLVFIDSDVGFTAADLVKLLSYDRDIVAGIYPKKQDEEEFPIAVEPGVPLYEEPDGCVVKGVIGLATGFMRIKRHVLEKMVETFKPRSFAGQGHKPGDPLYTVIFEREIANGKRYSGDYNFCRRWIALGGELAVDPTMAFTHEGAKQWVGQLGAFWRRKHGVSEQAFDVAVERLRAGDQSDAVLAALCEGWGNGQWQGSPLMLAAAMRMAKRADGPILETGSGLSTLVLALVRPDLEIHSLEHDPIWAMRTRGALEAAGVTNVTLHYAPLGVVQGKTRHWRWYVTDALPTHDWALVINDGPPRDKGDRAALYDVLGASIVNAALLVDDTQDIAQMQPVAAWAQANGREILTTEDDGKGVAVCHAPAKRQAA